MLRFVAQRAILFNGEPPAMAESCDAAGDGGIEVRTGHQIQLRSATRLLNASDAVLSTFTFWTRAFGNYYHDGSVERICQIIKC